MKIKIFIIKEIKMFLLRKSHKKALDSGNPSNTLLTIVSNGPP